MTRTVLRDFDFLGINGSVAYGTNLSICQGQQTQYVTSQSRTQPTI